MLARDLALAPREPPHHVVGEMRGDRSDVAAAKGGEEIEDPLRVWMRR
jgi:hypothetical protein